MRPRTGCVYWARRSARWVYAVTTDAGRIRRTIDGVPPHDPSCACTSAEPCDLRRQVAQAVRDRAPDSSTALLAQQSRRRFPNYASALKEVERLTRELELSKIDRLAIASLAAPRLRGQTPRLVSVVDDEGKVVRVTTSTKIADGMLRRKGIEIDLAQARSPNIQCRCGTCFVPKRVKGSGSISLFCEKCRNPPCTFDGCTDAATKRSAARSLADGSPAYCASHRSGRSRTSPAVVERGSA